METVYKVLYSLYFRSYYGWKRNESKLWEMIFRLNLVIFRKFLCGAYLHSLEKSKEYGLNQKQREQKVIASLTTFPKRINKVWIAIETIMGQTEKPDVIELWLAQEQFPGGIESLPESLKKQMQRGLSVRFCQDLRSHKKYYFAMQNHPDAVVITFDDDIFYPRDTVQKLMELHRKHPEQVIGMSCPKFTGNDLLDPLNWDMQMGESVAQQNLGVCGCAGTLFPPQALHANAFEIENMKKLCFLADDLWLTAMTYRNGKQLASVGRLPFPISVPDTQEEALTTTNNSAAAEINNNTQWEAVLNYYHEELKPWRETLL